jgi:hypothetical protein
MPFVGSARKTKGDRHYEKKKKKKKKEKRY